jgi:gamma-glutamylcyclotransferase (GGCT)/AIG2-like uncharacterized protein YtfP
MFYYGTLRPNRGRPSWGMSGDEPVIHNAYIAGRLWYVNIDGSYPVAKLDRPGRIQGDIVGYEPDSAFYHHVCDVESGAGYEMRDVEAQFIDGQEGADHFIETGLFQKMNVMTWHFAHSVKGKLEVPGNNWLRAQNRERRVFR